LRPDVEVASGAEKAPSGPETAPGSVPRLSNGMIVKGFSLNPVGRPKGLKERGRRRHPKQLLQRLFEDERSGIVAVRATFAAMLRDRRQRGAAIKLIARHTPHLLVRAIDQHFHSSPVDQVDNRTAAAPRDNADPQRA